MATWGDLFTPRQLIALTTFSDLVGAATERVRRDAVAAGLPDDDRPLREGGTGAVAYAEAVGVYLAFALSKQETIWFNSLCRWEPNAKCTRQLFGRQAIPMIWDYAEPEPLGDSSGLMADFLDGIVEGVLQGFEFTPAKRARQDGLGKQMQGQVTFKFTMSFQLIRPTTTTSATPTCRTSSTSGSAAP